MDLLAFGQFLREAREQREISLDEAVKTLKIQRRILESFEEGDFSQGGSPVQVRGMLRNYARYLRLEEDIVLQHYETALIPAPTSRWRKKSTEETQAARPATQPRRDTLTAIPLGGGARRSSGPRFAWVGRLLTTLVGLSLIGIITFFVAEILGRTPPPGGTQPTLAVQLSTLDPTLATATYTATWVPEEVVPTTTRLFTMSDNGIAIQMNFVQRSWVRVMGDGTEQFVGIARPGDLQSYTAEEGFEITLANAAAVEMTVNGQEQASFGARGAQVLVLVNGTGLQVIQPNATATLDTSRVISPESFTITETPDPALLPTIPAEMPTFDARLTPLAPTPIGAEGLPTETPLPSETAVVDAVESTTVPSLTPFNIADASTTSNSATATVEPTLTPILPPNVSANTTSALNAETTPVPTLTPFLFVPTTQAPQGTPVPTLTPFNFEGAGANTGAVQGTTSTPTQSAPATQAQAATATVRPSATPSATATATFTGTPDLRPTAIVPLRITQSGLPTRKAP